MSDEPRRTDYELHSNRELREAIDAARQEEPRIRREDSAEALEAERAQRRAMEDELRRRGDATQETTKGLVPLRRVRALAGGVLSGTATALAVGSRLTEGASRLVHPERRGTFRPPERDEPGATGEATRVRTTRDAGGGRAREDVTAATGSGDAREADEPRPAAGPPGVDPDAGAGTPPPTIAAPAGPAHEQAPATHLEELAAGTADEVAARIPRLSTDELRALYEHESANRNRKTVLDAVERAAAEAGRATSS